MDDQAKKDFIGMVMIFLVIGALWFYLGGKERSKNLDSPILSQPLEENTGNVSANVGGTQTSSGNSNVGNTSIKQYSGNVNEGALENVSLEKSSQSAPIKYKATLRVGSATVTDPKKEYVEIQASPENSGSVLIDNWTLDGKRGLNVKLGDGTYLPYVGQVNIRQPIYLQPGGKVIVVTGRSPIGTSFRLNKCTGYFEQFQDFVPGLPMNCPYPRDEDLPRFFDTDDNCYYYVKGLSNCRMQMDVFPINLSNQCIDYVNREVNYSACVNTHKSEKDFYLNEWRVYLGRDEDLWKDRREVITLRDDKGNVLDWVSY